MADRHLGIRFTAKNDATRAIQDLQRNVQGLQSTVGLVAKGLVALKLADIFKDGVGAVIGFSSSMEQAQIAFQTMTGSVDDAREHIAELKSFALKTPFEFGDLVEQSKRLQAYGIEVQNVIPTLTTLGNIAAGVGMDKLPQITLAFGQVRAAGKLFGTELRQFTEAGIPLIDALAEHFDVPAAAIRDMVSEGKVGFADVQSALNNLSGEGGKFADLMLKQSQTFEGAMSNIRDVLLQLGATAFAPMFDAIRDFALSFSEALQTEEAQSWAEAIGGLLAGVIEAFKFFGEIVGGVLNVFVRIVQWVGDRFGFTMEGLKESISNAQETIAKVVGLIKLAFSNMRYGVALVVLELAKVVAEKFDEIKVKAAELAQALSGIVRFAADLPLIGGFATGAADKLDEFAGSLKASATAADAVKTNIQRLKDEALREAQKIIGETTEKLDAMAEAKEAAGRAAGDAKPKIDSMAGSVDGLGKAAKEAKKSLEELLTAALALDAAMPAIKDLVATGDLLGAAEALMALGESAESAVSKVISMMKELQREAERAAEEAAQEAKQLAEEAAAAIRKAEEEWKERSNNMARAIIDALKAGKDWAAGTAEFFRNEWLEGLEKRIQEFAQRIRNAMRDGLDISAIVAEAQPLFDAYQNAVMKTAEQIRALQQANDDLMRSQEQLNSQLNAPDMLRFNPKYDPYQADAARDAWQRAQFGATIAEMKRDADKWLGITRNIEAQKYAMDIKATRRRIRLGNGTELEKEIAIARITGETGRIPELVQEQISDKLKGLLGANNLNGTLDRLIDVLSRMETNGILATLDGKSVSRQVSSQQSKSSFLLASMGGV